MFHRQGKRPSASLRIIHAGTWRGFWLSLNIIENTFTVNLWKRVALDLKYNFLEVLERSLFLVGVDKQINRLGGRPIGG